MTTDLMGNPLFTHTDDDGLSVDDIEVSFEETDGDDVEIEVVDDRPPEDRVEPRDPSRNSEDDDFDKELHEDEIKALGAKNANRFRRLQYEYHEQRRAREAAERMQNEAVSYAQSVQKMNDDLKKLLSDGEEVLLSEVRSRAKADLERAKVEYRRALDSDDQERIVNAQIALQEAIVESRGAENFKIDPVPQSPAPPPVAPKAQDPKFESWREKNRWFGNDKSLTEYAISLHNDIVKKGSITVSSEEYYNQIDREMRLAFPSVFPASNGYMSDKKAPVGRETQGEVEPAGNRKPPAVVAPASREGKRIPNKVQLTATEKRLAERLRVPIKDFALQKLRLAQAESKGEGR